VPVLREMNIPATIFLSVGYVGTDRILPHDAADDPAANRLLTWEEVAAVEGPLVSFGSHTMSHCRLAAAGRAARDEVFRSMEVLRGRLAAAEIPFSYPYGTELDFLPVHERMVRDAGFCCAC